MIMKTRYILATALLALAASSCTDLDVDVKSKLTEYPSSEIAMEGKMADAYYAFRKPLGNNYNRYQTFSSDEASETLYIATGSRRSAGAFPSAAIAAASLMS